MNLKVKITGLWQICNDKIWRKYELECVGMQYKPV